MRKPICRAAVAAVLAVVSLALFAGSGGAQDVYTGSGWDVSFPQCDSKLPSGGDFALVGVNNGIAWSANPCLAAQLSWASGRSSTVSVYANLADPQSSSYYECGVECPGAYGAATAADAVTTVSKTGFDPAVMFWWLDIETGNSWDGTPEQNLLVVQGYIAGLESAGVSPDHIGIYSTQSQWTAITGTGGAALVQPVWLAGAHAQKTASQYCDPSYSFTAGPVYLVQYFTKGYDADLACSTTSGGGGSGGGGSHGGGHGRVTRTSRLG